MAKEKVVELALDSIDTGPARAVRSGLNQDVMDRYREKYEEGSELPAVDVFQGPGATYCGDGWHRIEAKKGAMGQTILALVRKFKTDAEALEAAQDHAAGGNEEHGYARTAADKRAAVRSVIGLKRYAEASDNEIGRLCKVGHVLVRLVREEETEAGKLKGKATAEARDYKEDAKLRGGAVADGKGGIKAAGRATKEPEVPDTVLVAVTDRVEFAPVGRATNVERVRDARGRVVPRDLEGAFREGKKLAAHVKNVLADLLDEVKVASTVSWGKALVGTLPSVEVEMRNIRESVRCGIPAVVCPHVADNGEHIQGGNCKVCQNRGWITRGTWEQLGDELKAACDERAEDSGEHEAA